MRTSAFLAEILMDMAEHTTSHSVIGTVLGGYKSLETSHDYHAYVPVKH